MSYEGSTDSRVIPAPDQAGSPEPDHRWSPAKLIAFRFAFAITALSAHAMIGYVPAFLPLETLSRPLGMVLGRWDALNFRATMSVGAFIVRALTGSKWAVHDLIWKHRWNIPVLVLSDVLGLLVLAAFVAIVWTAIDQRRANYSALNRPMRVYLRYALGSVMLVYALNKVIPTQFGILTPGEMLRPIGQLSHFLLLWDFMAASAGYTFFSGLVELIGAALLFFRRTTLLGALVLAGGLTNVIAMDMGYHVGAIHFAIIFLLLDLILLAPYLPRLFVILLGQAESKLPLEPTPLQERWYHSAVTKGILVCVLASPLVHVYGIRWLRSHVHTGRSVHGLFDVTAFVRNGKSVAPLASDNATWKLVACDNRSGEAQGWALSVQLANGNLQDFHLTDDAVHHTWTIHQWGQNSTPVATLRYAVLQDRDVSLDGKLGNDSVHMLLHPVDMKKFFPLLTR